MRGPRDRSPSPRRRLAGDVRPLLRKGRNHLTRGQVAILWRVENTQQTLFLVLAQLYPAGDPNIVAQQVPPERIVAMAEEVTKGLGGDVGIVPRQFLRRLVNLFDAVAENPDAALPEPPRTIEEERAAEGKRPYDYEPEPGDDKGYEVTGVEF